MSDLLPAKAPAPQLPDQAYPFYGYGPMEGDVDQNSLAPLKRFLFFIKKFWWVPLLTLLLCAGGGGACVFYLMPPTYISLARMWETEKLNLPGGAAFSVDPQGFLGTQMELLRSLTVRQSARELLLKSSTNAIPKDKDGQELQVSITISPVPKSSILVVQASCSDGRFSQTYLNALMQAYLDYKKHVRSIVSGDTFTSISTQVLRLEQELKAAQDALTAFQRSNNLAILQEEGTIAGGYLAKLNTQLSDLQLEAQLLDATLSEQVATNASGTNAALSLAAAAAHTSSRVSGASDRLGPFQEVQLLKIQREKLSKNLRPKHPKIARLDAEIEHAQRLVQMYQQQNLDQLNANRHDVRMRIENVLGSIKEWRAKVVEANSRIAEAEQLKLNVSRTQSLYDRLYTLVQNVDITRNIDQETVAILDEAKPAERSFKREIMVLAGSAFGGLFFGLGIVFLVGILDTRFTSLNEVTEKVGSNIVGQVPDLGKPNRGTPLPLLESNDERYMYAESYRSLRSALLFQSFDSQPRPKVFLITSAQPNEGKSTIAANLARTLALGGARVLLVDADLRKGLLHKMMGLPSSPGLFEALQRPSDLDKITQATSVPNLFFIARGRQSGHPGDFFLRIEMETLLAKWREEFDHVVIDTCPVFAADDATTLAPKVDATLFVVCSRFSRAPMVREALELLNQRQAKVLGVVFNRADATARSYYRYNHKEYYAERAETGKAES